MRLVLSVIQRFEKRGESPDDLFQVGCIGLIKAISNFDPDKQVRFSTYGVPMIAGEVRRYLRDNSAIRVSRSIRDVAYRVLQCKEAMQLQLGREPTLEEGMATHSSILAWRIPWTEMPGGLQSIVSQRVGHD